MSPYSDPPRDSEALIRDALRRVRTETARGNPGAIVAILREFDHYPEEAERLEELTRVGFCRVRATPWQR